MRSDFDKQKRGDAATKQNADWLLFYGPGDQSLAFEFIWVTKPDDKFYAKVWAGGGIAFNSSWAAVDGTGARYLVFWAKTTSPGVEFAVNFQGVLKSKGKDATGQVDVTEFVPGGRLDETWRRIVIPLSEFPEIDQLDLKGLQQVILNLKGGYPENQKVTIFIDNLYLTNIDMVTPVSNLGYLVRSDGVLLRWDKDPTEKVEEFAISVNRKPVLKAQAKARSALVPRSALQGSTKAVIGIATVGASETSEEQQLELNPKPATALRATVKLGKPSHHISEHLFGINWGSASALKEIGATGRRWGGNRTTKYNWKYDVDSAGADWFFLNDYSQPETTPEQEKKYYQFIKETLDAGAKVNFCIPISDWIAKPHPEKGERYCSFPVSKYPKQERTDGQGCGNGKLPNGETIWGNDPSYSMVRNSPELQRDFVRTVVRLFGPASRAGVQFYSMDNEPGLWMHTHRDTLPKGISAEQLADLNIEYAKVVKSVDASAQVIGFGAWGVKALAGSNVDYMASGPDGYRRPEEGKFLESQKHGGDSQLVYLLKRFRAAEAKHGKRLIDIIDIHWYQELYGMTSKGEKKRVLDDLPYDRLFTPLQFEALREWYDPTFKPTAKLESWTHGANAHRLWDPYHPVIPALKKILETHYPGTKLAVNEYDNGSPEQYHGALLRAAALGIFIQEDLYMAQNWHQTDHKEFIYWAQKLYGNYDGQGSRVGGQFVPTESSHQDLLSYAARDQKRWMIVLINKHRTKRIATTIELPTQATSYRTFTLAETLGLRLQPGKGKARGQQIRVTLPPYAAILVEAG
jgi:hypothetical protein